MTQKFQSYIYTKEKGVHAPTNNSYKNVNEILSHNSQVVKKRPPTNKYTLTEEWKDKLWYILIVDVSEQTDRYKNIDKSFKMNIE